MPINHQGYLIQPESFLHHQPRSKFLTLFQWMIPSSVYCQLIATSFQQIELHY